MELENCPDQFRDNCLFYEVRCADCKAGDSSNKALRYSPIERGDLGFTFHPCYQQEKQEKKEAKQEESKRRKQSTSYRTAKKNSQVGLKTERNILKDVNAKATLGSGRVFGDADGYIVLPGGNRLFIEHKTRINNKNTLGPTNPEWQKAKEQGAEVFMTTSTTNSTVVTMSLETFKELLNLVNGGE